MIKLNLFTAEGVLWQVAYNKETELQNAAETAPQHIFFYPNYVEVVRALRTDGVDETAIAREHFNMAVSELRKAYAKARKDEHTDVLLQRVCKEESVPIDDHA